ncbi:hypothetical protein LZD49_28120 [Dyadobacter sp. CY261]|uniref:hypothetical protein n=1 Tax=Dyadobacter sp. CY261 TaxID=2907203 RepID=UPI001F44CBFC|nr:hypothetical protein [Dyadobacter sp. CY261]MCF0074383.1 hypothetical protein [Dyadobacter sp. CY261]
MFFQKDPVTGFLTIQLILLLQFHIPVILQILPIANPSPCSRYQTSKHRLNGEKKLLNVYQIRKLFCIFMGYYLEDLLTGEKLPVIPSRLSGKEIALLNKSKRFDFEWNLQNRFEVYGLRLESSGIVVGLVSFECQKKNIAIEIKLIANAKEHCGSRKRYDRIAGCLIAFVCAKSFDLNFDGYVYLKAKTAIIRHYCQKYGFVNNGNSLFTDTVNSRKLINEYYGTPDQKRLKDY